MEEIIEKILDQCELDYPIQTEYFLNSLRNGDEYHKRLLICLGIDFESELIEVTEISTLLNSLDYTKCVDCDGCLTSYELAVVDLGKFVSNKSNNPNELGIRLARVMKSSAFSAYFYPNIEHIEDVNLDWKEVKNEIERGNLESVKMPNGALLPRGLVWTTPLDDLIEIIEVHKKKSSDPTNEIVDRLGLITTATINNEYVYIEYDNSFDEPIFQPCNLSNCWSNKNSLYISCKSNDGFGRTRPRSGDNVALQMKEVVHHSIDGSRFNYNIKHLGNLNNFAIDTSEFNSEAMKRYTL